MTKYEDLVVRAFKSVCEDTGCGASPSEVLDRLYDWNVDVKNTVIDLVEVMKDLRSRGLL